MLSFKQRCIEWVWNALPSLLIMAAQVVAFVATRMGALELALYALPWILMYYFSLFTPRRVPYVVVFALGLLQDIVYGVTLGSSALVCMALRWATGFEQRVLTRENFVMVWGYFALLLGALWLVHWLLLGALMAQMPPLWPLVQRWLVALVLYPPVHHLLQGLTLWLSRREARKLYR